MSTRKETDSLGSIDVPDSALWGAQTQRSLQYFAIGTELPGGQRFPLPFIHTFALIKKAAALANVELGTLAPPLCKLITQACDEISNGEHDTHFPLVTWQTGSGTQTNMNLNEVIANRANEIAGTARGTKSPVHPNDHVNLSQSSNDVFPTVMNVVITQLLTTNLLPALDAMHAALDDKAREFSTLTKSGRTHMMDASLLTLGDEFSAYRDQLAYAREQINAVLPTVQALAIGGSAVGNGVNTPLRWSETVVRHIAELTGLPFTSAGNKFMALAAHDALTDLSGRLRLLATSLMKIANDLRLMNSGPRCGFAEIRLPANEPGSSIMPGKVNPTQVEALTMVAIQVLGNDAAVGIANSQGQFELNVYKPLVLRNVYESTVLLGDAVQGFTAHCLRGIEADTARLSQYAELSLMRAAELTPVIGYDKAAKSAQYALAHGLSLKQAVLQMGLMTEAGFDAVMAHTPES
jgi:fumarate hydratase class II